MNLIAGVEEAGRGPVIGPMVMVCCAIDQSKLSDLEALGVKDSKQLTPKKRDELFDQIKDICRVEIIELSNDDIDDALNDPSMNLNLLEAKTSVKLIKKLRPKEVILDCPSTNVTKYKQTVDNLIRNKDIETICMHKADEKFPIVSAASIIAKVTRDRAIESLKKQFGIEFGSGYPSDPVTIKFLEENFDKYPIFRTQWAPYKAILAKNEQKTLGDF